MQTEVLLCMFKQVSMNSELEVHEFRLVHKNTCRMLHFDAQMKHLGCILTLQLKLHHY